MGDTPLIEKIPLRESTLRTTGKGIEHCLSDHRIRVLSADVLLKYHDPLLLNIIS